MMSDNTRIEQFKQMAAADPDNELGHFSLGKAYLDAERFDEAVGPLSRAVTLNERMSKAHQLLGVAYEKAGQRDRAVEVLTRGIAVADKQGDRMPRDAMADLLRDWGAPVPALSELPKVESGPAAAAGAAAPGFKCSRCGVPHNQLEKAPFKGKLGQKILANVCATCWREWIPMGTKVINELGLVLSTPDGGQAYDQHMIEFLQLEDR